MEKDGVLRQKMLNDLKKEIFRKSIHLCAGFVPFFLAHFFTFTITALSSVAFLYIICEFLRLKGIRVPLISAVTETAARKRDDGRFVLGPVMLVLGILATALIFQPVPASIGIYALAFGDGFASLAGKLFGKHKLCCKKITCGKTVEGSLACFLAVFISSFAVTKKITVSLVLAVVATLIEVLPLKDFDNLIIPVTIAFCSHFLLTF